MNIGIMGAMPEEIEGILDLMQGIEESTIGNRKYYQGEINGIACVLVFSRWGKVAASSTVSTLIHHFGIKQLLFTGVAGAIANQLKIGDIIIGERYIQHDMDARPMMKQFEIPLIGKTFIEADKSIRKRLEKAAAEMTNKIRNKHLLSEEVIAEFGIASPGIYIGDIASGDVFVSSLEMKNKISQALPSVLCVEMEGAAVAQVCLEHGVPFCIIRTISDTADHEAHLDFPGFLKKVSGKFSTEVIKNYFHLL